MIINVPYVWKRNLSLYLSISYFVNKSCSKGVTFLNLIPNSSLSIYTIATHYPSRGWRIFEIPRYPLQRPQILWVKGAEIKRGLRHGGLYRRPSSLSPFLCTPFLYLLPPLLVLPCNCKLTLARTINFSRLGLLLKFSIHANRLFPELPSAHCALAEKSKKVRAIPRYAVPRPPPPYLVY